MEVQTNHFSNGEWVTRTVSLNEILANHRPPPPPPRQASREPYQSPKCGILSRTAFPSPYTKLILPARIRNANLNDVVFVGDRTLQLKSIGEYGHLHHVATKADFKGVIMEARVFGAFEIEASLLPSVKQEHSGSQEDVPPQVIVLTLSCGTLMFLWARSEFGGTVRFCQRAIALPTPSSPLLAIGEHLAVDPRGRALAVADIHGNLIIYKTTPISQWMNDPTAGAYKPNIVDERRLKVDNWISHMEFLSPGGKEGDNNHVILLLTQYNNSGKSLLSCYDWDHLIELQSSVNPRAERLSVDLEDQNISLVIPLKRSSDFLLVSATGVIALYRNILSGNATRVRIHRHHEGPARPATSQREPRFVQWVAPRRNSTFDKENFYIAREDGLVAYVTIGTTSFLCNQDYFNCSLGTAFASLDVSHEMDKHHPQFQQLASPLANADVLVGVGPNSDGRLNKVGSWTTNPKTGRPFGTFEFVESLPNWAMASDAIVTRFPGLKTGYERRRSTLLMAHGTAPYGAVSELRYGLNALIRNLVDLPSLMGGVTGLWVIDDGMEVLDSVAKSYITILVCLPPRTHVFRLSGSHNGDFDDLEELKEDESDPDGDIDRNNETILASRIDEGTSLQITPSALILLERTEEGLSRLVGLPVPAGFTVLAASLGHEVRVVVIAVRRGQEVAIRTILIAQDEDSDACFKPHAEYILSAEATCVEAVLINGMLYAAVCTVHSDFLLLKVDQGGLTNVLEEKIDTWSAEPIACDSVVKLDGLLGPVFVCGMRNGWLGILALKISDVKGSPSIGMVDKSSVSMGRTAARVIRSEASSSSAFATCGSDLCRIKCCTREPANLDISSIWFSDRNMPGYQQSTVSAMTQLPMMPAPNSSLSGSIFSVLGTKLVIAQFDNPTTHTPHPNAEVIPRKVEVEMTPDRLLYSEKLRMLVVATRQPEQRRPPRDGKNGYRTIRSAIKFLKLDDDTLEAYIKAEESDHRSPVDNVVAAMIDLKQYEKVHSLLEWTFVEDGKAYGFIVAGTAIQEEGNTPNTPTSGRKLFIKIPKHKNGEAPDVKITKAFSYKRPIYSMALFNQKVLLVGSGNELIVEEYNFQNKRWTARISEKFNCNVVYITASPPFIQVSTSGDGHFCYELTDEYNLARVFTDSCARVSTSHLALDITLEEENSANFPKELMASLPSSSDSPIDDNFFTPGLVLASDMGGSVVGFVPPPFRTHSVSGPIAFEAVLPRIIKKLHRADIRPPWRRVPILPQTKKTGASSRVRDVDMSNVLLSASSPGVVVDDILGTCVDGTVYSLQILTEDALELIKILEGLVKKQIERADAFWVPENDAEYQANEDDQDEPERMEGIQATSHDSNGRGQKKEAITLRDVRLDPGTAWGPGRHRQWHCDGDAIAHWLDGGNTISDLFGTDTSSDVAERIVELEKQVLRPERVTDNPEDVGMGGVQNAGSEEEVEQSLVNVDSWVRRLVGPLL